MTGIEKNGTLLRKLVKHIEDDEDTPQGQINVLWSMAFYRILEGQERLYRNPMVRMGHFLSNYPKLSALIGVALFVLANLWFVNSFRVAVLQALLPHEIFDFLLPYITVLDTGGTKR